MERGAHSSSTGTWDPARARSAPCARRCGRSRPARRPTRGCASGRSTGAGSSAARPTTRTLHSRCPGEEARGHPRTAAPGARRPSRSVRGTQFGSGRERAHGAGGLGHHDHPRRQALCDRLGRTRAPTAVARRRRHRPVASDRRAPATNRRGHDRAIRSLVLGRNGRRRCAGHHPARQLAVRRHGWRAGPDRPRRASRAALDDGRGARRAERARASALALRAPRQPDPREARAQGRRLRGAAHLGPRIERRERRAADLPPRTAAHGAIQARVLHADHPRRGRPLRVVRRQPRSAPAAERQHARSAARPREGAGAGVAARDLSDLAQRRRLPDSPSRSCCRARRSSSSRS